ncbi:hypothetical protein MPSEU_000361300 [Mayamaea pseudoterrestris]|nr:hypothetical protein MPSEU_000361300 [Mayamaea pseudoterrestris]
MTGFSTCKLVDLCLIASLVASCAAAITCRSNETHIAWNEKCSNLLRREANAAEATFTSTYRQIRRLTSYQTVNKSSHGDDGDCCYETLQEAQASAYKYLERHIMAFDKPFRSTLGFIDSDNDSSNLPDGLSGGLVGPTIDYALKVKQDYPWADNVRPRSIYYEYVLNYANVNEARSNWRPLLFTELQSLFAVENTTTADSNDIATNAMIKTLPQAVLTLNTHMWTLLAPRHVDSITFVGGSTPLIFDTMSVLSFGYASCTGLAILFVNALRTFGIPARVVGTPAWYQNRSAGNHNWVEVYHEGAWHFMEPSATRTDNPDSIDRDPCERWFCNHERFSDNAQNTTMVYAARLESATSTFYRMAWEWDNQDVPGEDVTAYYQEVCSQC